METGIRDNKIPWLGYGAEILTVFFALIVLAGRVYAQSYWKVFGLSAQTIDNNFVNYAIMSPNIAIASVLIAMSTIFMIFIMRKQPTDITGGNNPKVVARIGFVIFWIGLFIVGLIPLIDASRWILGTPGLVYGLAYLSFLGGFYTWMTAAVQLDDKTKSKIVATLGWVKNIPFIYVQVFFIVLFAASSIGLLMDVAQKFGANEAKEAYITSPVENIDLSQSKGFEDIVMSLNPDGTSLIQVKILAQANGFFYVSPGGTVNPPQLDIRAIPASQIQSIQYNVGVTPIGK
jgi:hypothetical protein